MNTNGIIIRLENKQEHRIVENLVRESFWNVYRPGAFEHYLLHILREAECFVPQLNVVMEQEGVIIGQSVCAQSHIDADDGRSIPTLMLGPICIDPACKRQGYGKMLLDAVFARAKEQGFGAVLFEGNIAFYGKSGCVEASRYGIRYPGLQEGEDASFFLARELQEGYLSTVTGVYAPPEIYHVSAEDVERFDAAFAPKEKKKLPGQLFN